MPTGHHDFKIVLGNKGSTKKDRGGLSPAGSLAKDNATPAV